MARSIVADPMGPHITARRLAARLLPVALVAAAALTAQSAVAQSGNGLYEPFPEAAVKKRAQRYVEGLRGRTSEPERRYSDAELAAGAFVRAGPDGPSLAPAGAAPSGPHTAAGPASARAGAARAGPGGDLALPWQLLLLALALTAPVALLKRERKRAAA